MSKKPKAVLISDIHFTLATLELASASLRAALKKARAAKSPCIIAGDTTDSKAILRGEVVNELIAIFREYEDIEVYLLVGNHDMLNEKNSAHALNFLKPYVHVIDELTYVKKLSVWMLPYQSDTEELRSFLAQSAYQGETLICHQGVMGADMGHYTQDKTSLPLSAFADRITISGHYHKRQTLKTGTGSFSYIGNPYTLSFGEADHPPKGYQILNSDDSLTPVRLELRKHSVMNWEAGLVLDAIAEDPPALPCQGDDLVWIKIKGPQLELDKIKKKDVVNCFGLHNFKLDKIPTVSEGKKELKADVLTGEQILDTLIDSTDEKAADKKALKALWREIIQ